MGESSLKKKLFERQRSVLWHGIRKIFNRAPLKELLFRLELEVLRILNLFLVMRWLRILGRIMYLLQVNTRNASIARMRAYYPETSTKTIQYLARKHHTNNIIHTRLDYLLMTRDAGRYESLIDLEGWEQLEKSLERRKGVVLLMSHVGFPRLLRWYLRTKDYQVYHLVRMHLKTLSGKSQRLRLRARFRFDTDKLMGHEYFSLTYMMKSYKHLKRNGIICISGDGSAGNRIISLKVCGRIREIRLGGIALGLMSGAPILPCFTSFDSDPKFKIQIQEPLSCPQGLSRSEQLRSLSESYVFRLEQHILHNPTTIFDKNYIPSTTCKFS